VPRLADAEAALGRLAGVGQLLPNPHLLIRPYLLREAVASTMIEGTQASLAEVFELGAAGDQPNADVEEVLAYVDAMEWAATEAPGSSASVTAITPRCARRAQMATPLRGSSCFSKP
jgi:Fic family protein